MITFIVVDLFSSIYLYASSYCSNENRFLGEHSDDDDVASLLNRLHKRADALLDTGHLEADLIALVTKNFPHCILQRRVCNIDSVFDATKPYIQ